VEVKRAVPALKSGDLKEAKKRLDSAHKLEPSSSDVNYLLGCLYYQERDFGKARSYLETASGINPRNVHTLALLGRVELMQQDYVAAVSTLEKAVMSDSDYWVAHSLLANAYQNQNRFEDARNQAELAIQKGKQAATSANLILGVALVSLGKTAEGIQALKTVVQDLPGSRAAIQASSVIAKLEE
jgi:Tfp pilus assembly protein PilF